MSTLKNIALKENIPSKIKAKPKFHKSFVKIIRKYGRIHEPELQLQLIKKTSPKALLRNATLGFRLWRKGKVKLTPSKVEQTAQLLKIFEDTSKEEQH